MYQLTDLSTSLLACICICVDCQYHYTRQSVELSKARYCYTHTRRSICCHSESWSSVKCARHWKSYFILLLKSEQMLQNWSQLGSLSWFFLFWCLISSGVQHDCRKLLSFLRFCCLSFYFFLWIEMRSPKKISKLRYYLESSLIHIIFIFECV